MEQNHSVIVQPSNAEVMEAERQRVRLARLKSEAKRTAALCALRELVRAARALNHERAAMIAAVAAMDCPWFKTPDVDTLNAHVAMLALSDNSPMHEHLQALIEDMGSN